MAVYMGKWALITGASAGIGASFAQALGLRGANLVLVARRKERLDALARQLSSDHGIAVRVIVADLSDPAAPSRIMQELSSAGIGVDILINNAGFGLTGGYLDHDWQVHRDFIDLMVTSYCELTHLCLPGMMERGFGRIIQVASIAGLLPSGRGHTLYGATKAFLVSFSQSLAAEFGDQNIHTTALCPGLTYTEFHDVNGTRNMISDLPSFMVMPVNPVIEGALRAVEKQHVVFVPGNVNKFLVWLSDALPRPWAVWLMQKNSARVRKPNKQ